MQLPKRDKNYIDELIEVALTKVGIVFQFFFVTPFTWPYQLFFVGQPSIPESMFVWPKYLRGDAIVSFRQSEKTCEATLWETSGTARGSQMLEIGAQNFFDIPSCADEYSISGGWITLATDGTATGEAPP